MFTGIIQNQGLIEKMEVRGRQIHFVIRWMRPEKRKIQLGESIAVNGVCLTVAQFGPKAFEVDVIRETLAATNLGKLVPGSRVNLERSLRWGDPMGGHFVSGHVDACGSLVSLRRQGKNVTYGIAFPRKLAPYIVRKGSIALDGVSLTVQKVHSKKIFEVGLVPHTLVETNLGLKKKGDWLNLEVDMIFRYLDQFKGSKKVSWEKIFDRQKKTALSVVRLKKQGF